VAKGELDIGVAAHLAVLAPFAGRRVGEILRRIQGWSRGRGGRQERDRAASPTRQDAAGRQLSSAHRSGSRWRRPHPGDHRPNPRAQSKPTTTIGLIRVLSGAAIRLIICLAPSQCSAVPVCPLRCLARRVQQGADLPSTTTAAHLVNRPRPLNSPQIRLRGRLLAAAGRIPVGIVCARDRVVACRLLAHSL
jgi:hypothetical protein